MRYIKGLNSSKFELNEFNKSYTINDLLNRPTENKDYIENVVNLIEKEVLLYGDAAITELTNKFDGINIDDFLVTDQEFNEAILMVDDNVKDAIFQSKENIEKFHQRQKLLDLKPEETSPGVFCWREWRAIENVGLYIPGGSASLFSTVLMLGIPAKIAGCKNITICTPVGKNGKVSPEILYSAKMLGIDRIYKIGGAQAIFAMAYGTKQVTKVDKIFGPGNAYVTEAKLKVSKFCAIDMPAGPSEVLIIADDKSNPKFIAADLLSQCEHGKDSQAILLCNSKEIINKVIFECKNQILNLPRFEIASKSLENSLAILVDDIEQAIIISNKYSPEHLILQFENWGKYIDKISNAGSVFCGNYSPESAGDYTSGTNHTLPTNGFAKSYSGVGIESFGKWVTFQELTKTGLQNIRNSIEIMSSKEGLEAHKNAVTIRF